MNLTNIIIKISFANKYAKNSKKKLKLKIADLINK